LKPIITLTTDFGTSDPYVAAVKGAILDINADATIVDLSHDVAPQRVEQAAFIFSCALPYFPRGSIHVVVVDPGVGTERRALGLITRDGLFIGPDNGVLSPALNDDERESAFDGPSLVALPAGKKAFLLENRRFQLSPTSGTFDGRDIFGPAAAHLSLGVRPSYLGPRVQQITAFQPWRAAPSDDGSLVGRIIHIDRFGNAITTIRGDQLSSEEIQISVADRKIESLCRSYADRSGLLALIGSSGFLEVSANCDSASEILGLRIGDVISVRVL
jgi:S-adenosyl-L-methionine hydrolase (adenosine-forming)